MAQDAAAEAPVLVAFYLTLLSVLMWVVLRGLKGAWQLTLGAMLEGLADAIQYDWWKIHLHFGGPLRTLDHKVVNLLAEAALGYEEAIGFWWSETARLQVWAATELWNLTRDTLDWATWLQKSHLPRWLKGAVEAAIPAALISRLARTAVVPELERLLHRFEHAVKGDVTTVVQKVDIPYLGQWQYLHRHWRGLLAAIAAGAAGAWAPTLPWLHIFPRLRDLELWKTRTRRRLTRLETIFGATVFAGLMANVLGLASPRCLRSGPIGRVARRLCGLPARALEDLLALMVDLLVVENLCQTIVLLEDVAGWIEPELVKFIDGLEDILCGGKYDSAPVATPVQLSRPPVTGVVLSLPS